MAENLNQRLTQLEAKIDVMTRSVNTLKNYFKWTLILTIVFFVVPLMGLLVVIPKFWDILTYSNLGL